MCMAETAFNSEDYDNIVMKLEIYKFYLNF